MDRDNDMRHIKNAAKLDEMFKAGSQFPQGCFGDTVRGRSFTETQSRILLRAEQTFRPVTASGWRTVWHNLTCWTIINTQPETADEIAMFHEAIASDR